MAQLPFSSQAFLTRLRRDRSGNVLAITAAMVMPLTILAGCVVDISRIYIVRSRLQSACDAGALAARRSMDGLTWANSNQTTGTNFFYANFPNGTMGSVGRSINLSANSSGTVTGTATTTVPPTMTRMLGFGNKVLTATCTAELQLPDSDIMFALDTTGSMNTTNPGDTVTRIQALRTAVSNFYTTLQGSAAPGATIRYGFVPFSSTVNVGYLLRREWMVDSWTYQSRVANGSSTYSNTSSSTTSYSAWTVLSGDTTVSDTYGSSESCVAPANTYSSSDSLSTPVTSPYPGGGTQSVVTRTRTENGSSYSTSIVNGLCRIRQTTYNNKVSQRTETTIPIGSTSSGTTYYWNYQPVTYDVSSLKGSLSTGLMAGGSITATALSNTQTDVTVPWSGCIEERSTTPITDYTNIPSGAYDMNIDLVPNTDDATKWRPFLPRLVYVRRSTSNWSYANVLNTSSNYTRADGISTDASVCPTQARKLATITSAALTSYVNSLTPGGYTYLDIGMLWAARLLSPTGLFAAENSANTGPVSRHIVFMTDGDINTALATYQAYGLEALDRRRTGSGTAPTNGGMDQIVSDRFDALCTAVKAKGITIWTVAFGTTLTTQLQNCASGGRAYSATNAAELNSAFQNIASRIAQLRITQ